MTTTTWIPVADQLPDDDSSVLIALNGESGEPVWIGYHDADGWHSSEGMPVAVTHWQDIPAGPDA